VKGSRFDEVDSTAELRRLSSPRTDFSLDDFTPDVYLYWRSPSSSLDSASSDLSSYADGKRRDFTLTWESDERARRALFGGAKSFKVSSHSALFPRQRCTLQRGRGRAASVAFWGVEEVSIPSPAPSASHVHFTTRRSLTQRHLSRAGWRGWPRRTARKSEKSIFINGWKRRRGGRRRRQTHSKELRGRHSHGKLSSRTRFINE